MNASQAFEQTLNGVFDSMDKDSDNMLDVRELQT